MSDDSGSTVGVWIPDDSDLVEQFDREVCADAARSKQIREAMELLIAVEEVRPPHVADNPRAKRHWVQSALLDEIRREGEE